MTWRLLFFLAFLVFPLSFSVVAQAEGGVGVGTFSVNGPKDQAYLSQAAQDAVVGALIKKGVSARSLGQVLDPDKLKNAAQGKGEDALLVAGRINIVGQTYRVLLKWADRSGRISQEYLEVAGESQLLPSLESFAASRLLVSTKTPDPLRAETAGRLPAPVVKPKAPEKVFKIEAEPALTASAQDYATVSRRLPYEVRALAQADLDGDGQGEILLTSKNELYVYRQQNGDLQEVARYAGKSLDHFVKVDVWSSGPQGGPWIVLTNLRGSLAASKILRYEGASLQAVHEDIPYQLRVLRKDGVEVVYGRTYRGDNSRYPIYEMKWSGSKLEPGEKSKLPTELGLYSFDYVEPDSNQGFTLAGLTPSGKLKLFKEAGGKYTGAWTSRDSYGGSANDVGVEVKSAFNEVVSDYYIVPLRLQALPGPGGPQLVVAKNDALLKDIIGRKPVISDGRMVMLKWDPLGMEEAWSSKKVDGSIMDYLVTPGSSGSRLLVAVRMRDQGFFEGVGKRKDSVLLVYELN